jgi:hypothetical protein
MACKHSFIFLGPTIREEENFPRAKCIFFFYIGYIKGRGSQAATIARVYFGFEFFCLSSIYTICTKVRFREVLGQDGLVQLGG